MSHVNNTSRKAVLAQDLLATRPVDLPEFEKPPVVDVVLSLQFSELRDSHAPTPLGIPLGTQMSDFIH